MLTEHPYGLRYLITALSSGPALFNHLLVDLSPKEADYRPDPDRFTIREIMAHLAEWDVVFLNRIQRICAEEHPTLPGYDEGELALQHNYAATDVAEQCRLFGERRTQLVDFLKGVPNDAWQRTADRPEIGIVMLEALVLLIPLHDSYHTAQVAQWRRQFVA